ncbi:ABC transporter permease [Bosea caraganae]|uniref:ABC transporter permease n=1 Tax=Bosea caraganae TaxID=2763117 RepID=A0A370KZA7_9HYPH|nr:ABC transporter permease [Bosea caraganae]RDJ19942.1 ABC transporter permease [Bosea caraganae]RDJ23880.1 ABC transporter permease [Bosea caraganae]
MSGGTGNRRSPAWIGLSVLTGLVFAFLLAPIAVVLIEAFNDSELMNFPPQGLSLRWFQAFFANAEFMSSLWLSLKLGLIAAAISTALGAMAGLALARSGSSSASLQTLLLAPLYVPRVLVGLALLLAFAWLNVSGSLLGMILGHVLITMPYATRTVVVGMRAVEPSVEEAARMLGATRWQTFRLVTVPIIRGALMSGFIFALIISFSDIYLALFISGPQSITLPLRLFTFMEWDQSPLVAAASAVQIVLILSVILVAGRLFGLSSPGSVE